MIKLAGKKAFVTDSKSGTGLATAGFFITHGAQIAIIGLDHIMLDEET